MPQIFVDAIYSGSYIYIDYANFDGYLKWFDRNSNDIQRLSFNLPDMADYPGQGFIDEYDRDPTLPPFPPLFELQENGNYLKTIRIWILININNVMPWIK